MSATLTGAVYYLPIAKGEKLLLLAMADHANDDGRGVYPGNTRLAIKTSDSERNVRRLLAELEKADLIARVAYPFGGRGHAVEWEVNADYIYTIAKASGWAQQRRTPSATFPNTNPAVSRAKPGGLTRETRRMASSQPPLTINNRDDDVQITETIPRLEGESIGAYLARIAENFHDLPASNP